MMNQIQNVTKANAYLLLVAVIWGATFPLIHNAIAYLDPYLFVALRFLLGGALLIPLVWSSLKTTNQKIILGCALLGMINGAAYVTQTLGLQTVPSARAAFITGLNVILIPLFAPLFHLGKLYIIDIICSLICLIGLYVMTGANLTTITYGDLWILLCAVLTAIMTCYLQLLSLQLKNHSSVTIAFYLVLFSAPLPLLLSFHADIRALFHPAAIFGLLFCAIAATSFVFYLQATYQRLTTVPKAALIYSLEPVFAAVFGFLINGEPITYAMFMGGLIILFSFMLPPLLQLFKKRKGELHADIITIRSPGP